MTDLELDQPIRPLFELVQVELRRQGRPALAGLTCGFDDARLTLVIGIEGAGRAELRDLVTGRAVPDAGALRFGGLRVDHMDPYARVRLGIANTGPQRLVAPGSLRAMLLLARALATLPAWRLAFGLAVGATAEDRADIDAILRFVGLERAADRPVTGLMGLEARLADLARCLAMRPRLVLVDRCLAGLGQGDRKAFARCLADVRSAGPAVVAIDDDLGTLGSIADRCIVLHRGRLVADATPAAIGADPLVFRALTGAEL